MRVVLVFLRSFRVLFLSLTFLLLLYTVLRVCFVWYNQGLLTRNNAREIGLVFLWGLKMDLSSIIFLNIPVFLLFFGSQYPGKARGILQQGSQIAFVGLNAVGLAINIIDIGYFRFSRHRSNIDLWYVFADSASSFGSVAGHYWPLILLLILLVAGLVWAGRKFFSSGPAPTSQSSSGPAPKKRGVSSARPAPGPGLLLCMQGILLFFLFIGARGWRERPLIPATPLLDIDPVELPLAQNSIGTLFYSLLRRQQSLKPVNYFTQDELNKILRTHSFIGEEQRGPADSLHKKQGNMDKKNVVICILESFCRGYLVPGDPIKAVTPFFDSLIRKSIFFSNARANGFTSNQGIVAILGGLPPFLDEPFFYSAYANTPLRSIGNILKEKGYNTSFFLGAGKDHFGFEKFTHMAGIDHYYCQVDFNDDRFYDGNWGIFDEPFLQFGARVLAEKQAPFMAVFFNISSHPPFTVPAQYRDRFNFPGQSAPQRSISYVDYSFQRFFATCEKAPWFRNTIFIFCADHWVDPLEEGKTHNTYVNSSPIPIFIFDPSRDSGTVNNTVAAQVDLTPTILGLLNYKGSYSGFGNNLLDSSKANNYAVNKIGDTYQVITRDFVLGYDRLQDKTRYLYRYSGDDLQGKNLVEDSAYRDIRRMLERIVRANIQCYNQALIRRSLE